VREVVLTEERSVVEKRAVPKERVRFGKEAVTDEKEVAEQVRKEEIVTEAMPRRLPKSVGRSQGLVTP
jgi:stress response protein YsnF